MDDFVCLVCSECGDIIEVEYSTARKIWDYEEKTGDTFTCGDCPDAYQKSQLVGRNEVKDDG